MNDASQHEDGQGAVRQRPSTRELIQSVREHAHAIFPPEQEISLTALTVAPRLDAPDVLLVTTARGRKQAVLACSSPAAPDMVARAMARARRATQLVPEDVGRHIVKPLAEGRIRGMSYALMPRYTSLSKWRALSWVQRAALRSVLMDWLWRLAETTVAPTSPGDRDTLFARPLEAMASLTELDAPTRDASREACRRVREGLWTPSTILMHGDMWAGNILIRPTDDPGAPRAWRRRFVVIDWPGSEVSGYPFFDLVRLAPSLQLSTTRLAREVARHCAVLGCTREDAQAYLLAALGHFALHLEQFPMENFVRMVHRCRSEMARALATDQAT